MILLTMAALKFAVFWSSRKLTSLPGTGASAPLPALLTIFHSLCTLQRWRNCTQMGHSVQQRRRRCIPAQHRRAEMTRPPRLLRLHAAFGYQGVRAQEGKREFSTFKRAGRATLADGNSSWEGVDMVQRLQLVSRAATPSASE